MKTVNVKHLIKTKDQILRDVMGIEYRALNLSEEITVMEAIEAMEIYASQENRKLKKVIVKSNPSPKSAEEMLLAKCSENKVFLTSNEIHTIIEAMLEYSRQGESDTITTRDLTDIDQDRENR